MLHRARDSSDMHASGRLELVQPEQGEFGFIVVQPIYVGHPESVEARRESLRGFLVAVYKLTEFFDRAMALTGVSDAHTETRLLDRSAPEEERLLHRTGGAVGRGTR